LTYKDVLIEEKVARSRISDNAHIHPGCRIFGGQTLVCKDAELGLEAPVTLKNCFVGPGVKLKGGYFENAVFLEGAEAGSGAHVRSGTILEEQVSIAHTVGLKQTLLFPFVTLGSLINFCDCLMAGGTDRRNHSEVGSSYIHFNYTPNQDKATASLIGDVPQGVMLDNKPIFLGGQGGLVGPCRIAYGTVIAAGSIYRKDQLKPDRLVFEGGGRGGSVPYTTGVYRNVKRQAINNIIYVANLVALMAWYTQVRQLFIGDRLPALLFEGLVQTLDTAIGERIKRFVAFCEKMPDSTKRYKQQMGASASGNLIDQKNQLYQNRHQAADRVRQYLETIRAADPEPFPKAIEQIKMADKSDYLTIIKNLKPDERAMGVNWLQGIVDNVKAQLVSLFPAMQ
jgi:UDP-N-acetylglucosamine/UDP-N-acetylgalactosamine diphosphorylase